MWEAALIFVVKKQVSIFLRGTHSTIMPPLGNYQNWFFWAKCSIQGQEIKKKYTQQGFVQVPLPSSLEISSCRCILNTAQLSFICCLLMRRCQMRVSEKICIFPLTFEKSNEPDTIMGLFLFFQGCTHVRFSLKKSQCSIL